MAYFLEKILGDGLAPRMEMLDDPTAFDAFSRQHTSHGMKAGIPFPPEIVPHRFQTEGNRAPVHSFFSCVVGTAVDDRFVAAVEALSPGVHQFIPVEITTKDGRALARPHFLLNCCTRIESIDPARSYGKIKGETDDEGNPSPHWYFNCNGSRKNQTVFKDRIAGHAMWWDIRASRLFVSDDLWAALNAAGISGLQNYPRVEEG
jgi:hypothetical protein